MSEGQGGWKDIFRKAFKRKTLGNQIPSTEIGPENEGLLLRNGEFARNVTAEERLKGIVINPDAVAAGRPEVRLVDDNETVVKFVGEPAQFAEFIKQAQATPLKDYPSNPFINGKWLNSRLRRTGIEFTTGFEHPPSSKAGYLSPENPEGLPIRLEIVGADFRDGKTEIYFIYPESGSVSVPTTGEISRSHRNQEEFGLGVFSEDRENLKMMRESAFRIRGGVDYIKYATENPFMAPAEQATLRVAFDNGSIIFAYHNDESFGSPNGAGNFLHIDKRKPGDHQRINPYYVGRAILKGGHEQFRELIVPNAAARNLRVPHNPQPVQASASGR